MLIYVHGLDNNFDPIDEIITLTGTTQKLSTHIFQCINSLEILSFGSNRKSVGEISICARNNSNLHAVINAEDSCILPGQYTIPRGYYGMLDT